MPGASAPRASRWRRRSDFAPAFAQALEAGRPAVIELKLDPEAISVRKTLSEIRAQR